jgi:peptidoglycan/xylan/chitin deacetylase (PgdA/CDA1 family)
MYHRVLPADDERVMFEEPGMTVTPATFNTHLELINKYFVPVRLSEWVERCTSGASLPGNSCAITFDDGWSDNHEFAFPILQKWNIPATIFLVTGLIGTDMKFWPEQLARLLTALSQCEYDYTGNPATSWLTGIMPGRNPDWRLRPDPEYLATVINNAKSFPDEEIYSQIDRIKSALNITLPQTKPSLLDWEQVSAMTESGLVDVASHTRTHTRLGAGISSGTLEGEIAGSKADIERQTGHRPSVFCYPNGDYSTQALAMVRNNFRCAVTTRSGWNTCGDDVHLLRRIAIHEDIANDETAFLARISGWM